METREPRIPNRIVNQLTIASPRKRSRDRFNRLCVFVSKQELLGEVGPGKLFRLHKLCGKSFGKIVEPCSYSFFICSCQSRCKVCQQIEPFLNGQDIRKPLCFWCLTGRRQCVDNGVITLLSKPKFAKQFRGSHIETFVFPKLVEPKFGIVRIPCCRDAQCRSPGSGTSATRCSTTASASTVDLCPSHLPWHKAAK